MNAATALARSDISATIYRMPCGHWTYVFAGKMYDHGGVDMKRIVALADPVTRKSRELRWYVHADVGVVEERNP